MSQQQQQQQMQIYEILAFFVLTKRIRKKNRPIKDKVQIKNADMRIIK